MKPKFVQPIILEVEPRISGGVIVAVAKTVGGGAASVTWDTENKSWVFAEGFGVGTVFAADPCCCFGLWFRGGWLIAESMVIDFSYII